MRLTNGVTREINLNENKIFLVEKEENACSNALSSGKLVDERISVRIVSRERSH